MNLSIEVEKPSKIVRKLKIKVPAQVVASRYERSLNDIQRTANLKGFRPGHAPLSVVRQFYGEDVRHKLYHSLIDESFAEAVKQEKIKAVSRPTIESPEHEHGAGAHDHGVHEDRDFTYTATVEILPELEIKGYTGIPLTRTQVSVADKDIEEVVTSLLNANAELVPVEAGSRVAKKEDHVEITFKGGLQTDSGLDEKPGMSGTRLVEIGSDSLIRGFEDELIGMNVGQTKTFTLDFPKDYFEAEFQGKKAEFTVTLNEIKAKKLPALDDEFAKLVGYENLQDLRAKAQTHLTEQRTRESEAKLRSDLMQAILAKNEFDVPQALVESQTRALVQEWAADLKQRGVDDATIQSAVMQQLPDLRRRAEGQVRGSLVLEAISTVEKIEVKPEEIQAEIEKTQLQDFYAKNPSRKDDLEFRLRQEATLKFLVDKAKIKS